MNFYIYKLYHKNTSRGRVNMRLDMIIRINRLISGIIRNELFNNSTEIVVQMIDRKHLRYIMISPTASARTQSIPCAI